MKLTGHLLKNTCLPVRLACLAVSWLVLSGCLAQPQQSAKPNVWAEDSPLESDQSVWLAEPSLSPEPTATVSNLNSNKGATMKTIADFQPIAATQVTLTTTKGVIVFKLFREEAPLTTLNFLNLAQSKFYDGLVFHRVIPDFMAQVGDPLTRDEQQQSRWGSGGPGYAIADETNTGLKHNSSGMVSMANSGPNTGGSQFFITYGPTPWLDGKHAVFGQVEQGINVLEQITVGDKILSVSYE